jgi:hypothetical protein
MIRILALTLAATATAASAQQTAGGIPDQVAASLIAAQCGTLVQQRADGARLSVDEALFLIDCYRDREPVSPGRIVYQTSRPPVPGTFDWLEFMRPGVDPGRVDG